MNQSVATNKNCSFGTHSNSPLQAENINASVKPRGGFIWNKSVVCVASTAVVVVVVLRRESLRFALVLHHYISCRVSKFWSRALFTPKRTVNPSLCLSWCPGTFTAADVGAGFVFRRLCSGVGVVQWQPWGGLAVCPLRDAFRGIRISERWAINRQPKPVKHVWVSRDC